MLVGSGPKANSIPLSLLVPVFPTPKDWSHHPNLAWWTLNFLWKWNTHVFNISWLYWEEQLTAWKNTATFYKWRLLIMKPKSLFFQATFISSEQILSFGILYVPTINIPKGTGVTALVIHHKIIRGERLAGRQCADTASSMHFTTMHWAILYTSAL